MTPKEVMYLEDALSHAQFLTQQCRDAANKLQDNALQQQVQQLTHKNQELFRQFYSLI